MNLKPEVIVRDGNVWLFIGADYKILTPAQAQNLVAKMQGSLSSIRRDGKRIQRKIVNKTDVANLA
mgnify:CR=1 FL=1